MFATHKPGSAVRFGRDSNCVIFGEKLVAIHGLILAAIFSAPSVCTLFAKIGLAFAKICKTNCHLSPPADSGELAENLIAKISLELTKSRVAG
jgi:hypothetical protein